MERVKSQSIANPYGSLYRYRIGNDITKQSFCRERCVAFYKHNICYGTHCSVHCDATAESEKAVQTVQYYYYDAITILLHYYYVIGIALLTETRFFLYFLFFFNGFRGRGFYEQGRRLFIP